MTDEAGDAMTTTTTTYADAVRRALDDLPAARYLELVDGLDEHLAEVQADGGASLAEVLGPPDTYAAELRSSAGLPPRAAAAGTPLPPPVAPPPTIAATPARPAIDRRRVARAGLVLIVAVLALWMLMAKEIGTVVLALLVAGVLGATWLVRRLLRAAALGEVAHRRASIGVTVGSLVVAAALGSMPTGFHGNVDVYPPGVTFATVPYPVSVPDFRGMTVGDAQVTAAQVGLATVVQMIGAEGGVVLEQTPPPGSGLMPGQSVTLLVGATTGTRPPSPITTTTVVIGSTTLAPTSTVAASSTIPATTVAG